jgi:hypothetical protein
VQEVLNVVALGAWLETRHDVLVWNDWLRCRDVVGPSDSSPSNAGVGDGHTLCGTDYQVIVHPGIVAAIATASMWKW